MANYCVWLKMYNDTILQYSEIQSIIGPNHLLETSQISSMNQEVGKYKEVLWLDLELYL